MSDFHPGQVWTYRTRPGEGTSRLVICKVEPNDRLGMIIHIRIEGLGIKNPSSADGLASVISHMPFDQRALRESVLEIESTIEALPDFEEGYNTWKQAFDQGQAGVFTISPAEAVQVMEQALSV